MYSPIFSHTELMLCLINTNRCKLKLIAIIIIVINETEVHGSYEFDF